MRLVALIVAAASAQAACTNPKTRQDWTALPGNLKSAYVAGIQALTQRPISNQYSDPSTMSYYDFTIGHSNNAYWAHGNAQFYVYHRAMLHVFEQALVSTGKWPADQGIPYWDWSAMSQNWQTSDIWSSQYLGAATSSDVDHCVLDGPFRKGAYSVAPDATGRRQQFAPTGDQTCLRRDAQIQYSLTDATSMADALSATSYVQFTCQQPVAGSAYFDESNFHSTGHGTLGGKGDMGNPSVSPNDPIFWLHHGFVDKYYWRWQQECEQFKYDYSGVLSSDGDPMSSGTNQASPYFNVDTWPFQVAQLLDTQGDTLCYKYSKSAGDIPPSSPPKCPPVVPITPTSNNVSITATTSATGVPTPSVNPLDKSWLVSGLVTLIQTKGFSASGGSKFAAVDSFSTSNNTAVVVQRRQESGDDSDIANTYSATANADGTYTVSFSQYNHTIQIPDNYTIHTVFTGSVTALNEITYQKTRFFPVSPEVEYLQHPNAPTNVTKGSSDCYLAHPILLSEDYFQMMNHDYNRYINARKALLMRIDTFNADNCTSLFSPSSLRHHDHTH
ncbi:hypothetical protein BC830DRAFT_1145733 [Chytriomyces sp. MP71]|nr:hypothetical protein BC830DRAFT_1145733 [Chytriomyces sp. MP71]